MKYGLVNIHSKKIVKDIAVVFTIKLIKIVKMLNT